MSSVLAFGDELHQAARRSFLTTHDPYWARRFCETAVGRSDLPAEEVAKAVHVLAAADPSWFATETRLRQCLPLSSMSFESTDNLISAVASTNPSVAEFVRGRLWLAAAPYQGDRSLYYARARTCLEAVAPDDRDGEYWADYGRVLASIDHLAFIAMAREILQRSNQYLHAELLHGAMGRSAHVGDWSSFDWLLGQYRGQNSGELTDPHAECAVLNLEGLKAMAQGNDEALEAVVARLLTCATNVEFLGTPETLVLVQRLVSERKLLNSAKRYLEMAGRAGMSNEISELLQTIARETLP